MKRIAMGLLCSMMVVLLTGCGHWFATAPATTADTGPPRKLTVIVALSAVPLGITGHTGVAVDDQYWDFGPDRVATKQRLQGLGSPAGPWWDDPQQLWQRDRSLAEVFDDLPSLVHPEGSVVVVFTAWVTDAEARGVERYWAQRYDAMAGEAVRYELTHRQCSSVGCHSVGGVAGLPAFRNLTPDPTDLPPHLRVMTPTVLAAYLRLNLRHTAGPNAGRRAEANWLQLKGGDLVPYDPPLAELLGIRGEALDTPGCASNIE